MAEPLDSSIDAPTGSVQCGAQEGVKNAKTAKLKSRRTDSPQKMWK